MIFNGCMEPPRESSKDLLARVWKDIQRDWRRHAAVREAWDTHLPERFYRHCKLDGLRSGVLTVLVPDDATRFLLDRELRDGLLQRLIAGCKAPLKRVKLIVKAPSLDPRSQPDREAPPDESPDP